MLAKLVYISLDSVVGVSIVKGLYKPNDYDNSPLIIHVTLMGT